MRFFVIIICLFAATELFANPYSKRTGRLTFDIKTSYLSSTENLNSNGDIVDLPASHKFEEIKTNIRSEYDYSRNTTFYADLVVNSAKSFNGTTQRNETSPSELIVGMEYALTKKLFTIMPSLQVKAPLLTYSNNTDSILLNNNSYDIEALLHIAKRWRPFHVRAYAGFTYRTEGLSWLMPIGAEVVYSSRRYSLSGGIESYFSITDDDYTSNKTYRTDVTDRVNGGSFAYNALNPSLTKVYGIFKFYIEPQLHIGIGAKQSLFGENAPYGTEFYGNLGFSFGGERAKRLPVLKAQDLEGNTDEFELRFDNEIDKDADVFNNSNNIQYRENTKDTLNNVERDIEIKLKKQSPKKTKKRR